MVEHLVHHHRVEAGVLERQRVDAGLVQGDRASRPAVELCPCHTEHRRVQVHRVDCACVPTQRSAVAARPASGVEQTKRSERASDGRQTTQDDLQPDRDAGAVVVFRNRGVVLVGAHGCSTVVSPVASAARSACRVSHEHHQDGQHLNKVHDDAHPVQQVESLLRCENVRLSRVAIAVDDRKQREACEEEHDADARHGQRVGSTRGARERETIDCLVDGLDLDRLSARKLFPEELKGRSW